MHSVDMSRYGISNAASGQSSAIERVNGLREQLNSMRGKVGSSVSINTADRSQASDSLTISDEARSVLQESVANRGPVGEIDFGEFVTPVRNQSLIHPGLSMIAQAANSLSSQVLTLLR